MWARFNIPAAEKGDMKTLLYVIKFVPVPVGHETDYPGITYLVSKLGNETAFSPFASQVL